MRPARRSVRANTGRRSVRVKAGRRSVHGKSVCRAAARAGILLGFQRLDRGFDLAGAPPGGAGRPFGRPTGQPGSAELLLGHGPSAFQLGQFRFEPVQGGGTVALGRRRARQLVLGPLLIGTGPGQLLVQRPTAALPFGAGRPLGLLGAQRTPLGGLLPGRCRWRRLLSPVTRRSCGRGTSPNPA